MMKWKKKQHETNSSQGGMESFLTTLCGSPAYAAPELVAGRQYLGSEVRFYYFIVFYYRQETVV